MKIYTRTGDTGTTGLFGGPRVLKDDVRIEAAGTVDELNAFIGLARAESLPAAVEAILATVQNDLFNMGAELASPDPEKHNTDLLADRAIEELEFAIDELDGELPPLKTFILPAGSRTIALLHVARGICRRAERRVVSLSQVEGVRLSPRIVRYLNRLSDYLFVAARATAAASGVPDVLWQKPDPR